MAKGRYHKWLEPDNLLRIEAWCRDGLTEEDIAKKIGITRTTLSVWKNSFPALVDALKRGKEVVDILVENALYKRAMGYEFTETKETSYKDGEGKLFKRVEKFVKKLAPDVTAQIFWLKNRKKDEWRDAQKKEHDEAVLALRKKELELKEF